MIRALVLLAFPCPALAQASAGAELAGLLEKASRQAERFAVDFSAVTCTEMVVQMKLSPEDKVIVRRAETYDYLILLNRSGDGFSFEESRILRSGPGKQPQQPLLATTGFAVLALVFHPDYQSSYRFARLEPEVLGGRRWERVRFDPIPGRNSPSLLEVGGRQYPLEWRGVAWLEPESGAAGRIEVEIPGAFEDIGLTSLRSVVEYEPDGAGHWLPRRAVIEARTRRQRWRNQHEFTAYRRFEVSTQQKVEEVQK